MGIKEGLGWILLLIGSGGTGLGFALLLTLPDFDIVNTPVFFLLVLGALYIGWRLLRRPAPESNKKLIAIIVIVVILSTAYNYHLQIEYHYTGLPELPKIQNESIKALTPIPAYLNYEKYGFSFACSPGMMNISEEGYLSDEANDNSGVVIVENERQTKALTIGWYSTTQPLPLEEELQESLDFGVENLEVSDLSISQATQTSISETPMIYRTLNYRSEGIKLHTLMGVWYDTKTQRMFYVGIDTYDEKETEKLFGEFLDSFTTSTTPIPTTTSMPTSEFEEEFIDKYREAKEMFYGVSYESEEKAKESAKLAGSYYERDQLSKAGDKYHEAVEFYSKAREQDLEAKTLFEEAYEIAPTEYYRELCGLHINATQSDAKSLEYISSAMKHLEKACDYYEKGDYIAGDEEVEEQGKDIMRHNIEMETYNMLMEKINEIEYR